MILTSPLTSRPYFCPSTTKFNLHDSLPSLLPSFGIPTLIPGVSFTLSARLPIHSFHRTYPKFSLQPHPRSRDSLLLASCVSPNTNTTAIVQHPTSVHATRLSATMANYCMPCSLHIIVEGYIRVPVLFDDDISPTIPINDP